MDVLVAREEHWYICHHLSMVNLQKDIFVHFDLILIF